MNPVSTIMTAAVRVVSPQDSVRSAAELMQQLDVGALPVCSGERLVGMLTDRDITVRGVAAGLDAEYSFVSQVMTEDVLFCTADQDIDQVMQLMYERQVRRLPVVDSERRLVGIVALADLALRQGRSIDTTVRGISQPDRSSPR